MGKGQTRKPAETSRPTQSRHSPPENELTRGFGDVATIQMDDLYEGWTGLDPPLFRRLEAWVVLPLSNSLPARFLVYDWAQSSFTRWAEVPPTRFLIIEGVGAGDAVTRKLATTKVWLDISDGTGRRRGLCRDSPEQSEPSASQELHANWSAWQELQAEYFATSGNRAAADFSVDTTQP